MLRSMLCRVSDMHISTRREEVVKAMRVCGRDLFVPQEHHAEALIDSPIHLDAQVSHVWLLGSNMHPRCCSFMDFANSDPYAQGNW